VNGNLTLDFGEVNLTSYAGLELLQWYLRRMDLDGMIRRCFQGSRLGGDFGVRERKENPLQHFRSVTSHA